jgi:hypothetical protein
MKCIKGNVCECVKCGWNKKGICDYNRDIDFNDCKYELLRVLKLVDLKMNVSDREWLIEEMKRLISIVESE